MKITSFLFALLFILPIAMFADIVGTYTVSGYDPQTNLPYTGTVVITKSGHIYTGQWSFVGGGGDTGTGIRKNDCLSFVFSENVGLNNGNGIIGVQQYKIKDDTLSGQWVRFGATLRGTETIEKVTP